MPQRPIPDVWRQEVKRVLAEHYGDISVRHILLRLKDVARELEKSDDPDLRSLAREYPSERTISRIKAGEWPQMSETEQAQYRTFYWPESMERGDLPWEASASSLELLGWVARPPLEDAYGRPTVRVAKWFARVSMAVPDLGLQRRHELAIEFAAWEVMGYEEDAVRGWEVYLFWAPWRSPERQQEYDEAIEKEIVPLPFWVFPPAMPMLASLTPKQLQMIQDDATSPGARPKTGREA